MDWTEQYDQKGIASKALRLIELAIDNIHSRGLRPFRGLKRNELAFLLRFPIHVGTNLYIDRLFRYGISGTAGPTDVYFKDTVSAVQSYYYDWSGVDSGGIKQMAKAVIRRLLTEIKWRQLLQRKPAVIGEDSRWLREFFPAEKIMAFNRQWPRKKSDRVTRAAIREACQVVALRELGAIVGGLKQGESGQAVGLYGEFIDHILPQAVVEQLPELLSYYEKMLNDWKIKQLHSFTGYYYNDNFKVFALLAKRQGAQLVGHQHGASNMLATYKQAANELSFLDYYFAWGKNESEWLKKGLNLPGLRILNCGCTYLEAVPKWVKRTDNPASLILLYPSGPLMRQMTDLEEISPERNLKHRLQVLAYLKELKKIYPGLRILYKPFPGTFVNDPIKELFAEELKKGVIEVVDKRPLNYYGRVDVVLWDSISTGFAESIQSGVPTLVFHHDYEYWQATEKGKAINRDLAQAGIAFYDIESGLRSFNKVINDLPGFTAAGKEAIGKFQEEVAWPVSSDDFFTQAKELA